MDRLQNEVKRELSRFGAPARMVAVLEVWPAAVGDVIAANAWPARIARDEVLHVATSSSVWAFELSQLAGSVLERLGELLGEEAPRGLRFSPGRLPEPSAAGPAQEPVRPAEPSIEEQAQAEELSSSIEDPELRGRVARAAALSLARGASGRAV